MDGVLHTKTHIAQEDYPDFLTDIPTNIAIENMVAGYTIWKKMAEGKLGNVYKAWQHSMKRWVMIKIFNPSLLPSYDIFEKFIRERTNLVKLNHPCIIKAIDSGQTEGFYFLVMEYFEGVSLDDYIRAKKKLDTKETIQIGLQLTSALQHIWEHGLIHRDIMPENILVHEGQAKLFELGLACMVEDHKHTPYRIPRSSYSFLSPERIQQKALDYQSDVYSLGSVFFYALTGKYFAENLEYEESVALGKISDLEKVCPDERDLTHQIATMLTKESVKRSPDIRATHNAFLNLSHKTQQERIFTGKGRSFSWFILAAILITLVLSRSWIFESQNISPKASQVFEECVDSVVLIDFTNRMGGGVVLEFNDKYFILTSAHIIKDALTVPITLRNGKKLNSKVVVCSLSDDLALLEILSNHELLTPATLATVPAKVGDDVFVIGHPKGYRWSLTKGTVSGVRGNIIQTDAAINPGNSGGPLINRSGEMIGLSTYIIGKTNPIGFAIATSKLQDFLRKIDWRNTLGNSE